MGFFIGLGDLRPAKCEAVDFNLGTRWNQHLASVFIAIPKAYSIIMHMNAYDN